MALTVETGAGVVGADSFITLVEFDALQVDYFGAALAGSDANKDAAVRRAWLYLKSLAWKSEYPFPTLGGAIPDDVKVAQAALARYELQTPNGLQPSIVPGQQRVLNRVGEIGWQVTGYAGIDAQRAVVTMAGDLLKPFLQVQTGFLLRA